MLNKSYLNQVLTRIKQYHLNPSSKEVMSLFIVVALLFRTSIAWAMLQ